MHPSPNFWDWIDSPWCGVNLFSAYPDNSSQLLLQYGANPNRAKVSDGITPLHYAAWRDSVKMMKGKLDDGVYMCISTQTGRQNGRIWYYSYASLQCIRRDWVKLCPKMKLPCCQYRNNYKISHGTESYMPYRRACLISGCAPVKLHCILFLNSKYHHANIIIINKLIIKFFWW